MHLHLHQEVSARNAERQSRLRSAAAAASRLALLLSALLPLLLLLHPLANNTKRGVTNKTLIQEWLVLRTSTQT